jgi:hypothetical protein
MIAALPLCQTSSTIGSAPSVPFLERGVQQEKSIAVTHGNVVVNLALLEFE